MVDWKKFAEKILAIDQLPYGYLRQYNRDVAAVSVMLARRDFEDKIRDIMGQE